MVASRLMTLPADVVALVERFRLRETLEALAVLVIDDGFDLEAIRLLSAWQKAEHGWVQPSKPIPDDGRPTPRAYAWLVAGMDFEVEHLADAAGLSISTTRSKLAQLLAANLLLPDGEISKPARAAIQATIADRIRSKKKAKRTDPETAN